MLWRDVLATIAPEYPDVTHDYLHVDNASMQIIVNPRQFDVMLTNNMFGDILSDEASVLAGSLGMLGSASLNAEGFGMYEPIHGSAPDIAGAGQGEPDGDDPERGDDAAAVVRARSGGGGDRSRRCGGRWRTGCGRRTSRARAATLVTTQAMGAAVESAVVAGG